MNQRQNSVSAGLPKAGFIVAGLAASGLVALGACAGQGGAEGPAIHGDYSAAASGLSYAREACASCHAVEAGETASPEPAAPAFEALANRRDMTRPALAALLRSPHRSMPSLIVEADRIDDLAAYLASLKAGE